MRAVFLDFDGVIVDSIKQSIFRWNETSRVYGKGIAVTEDLVRNSATGVWRIFYTEKLGIPSDKVEVAGQLWRDIAKKDKYPQLFEGMEEVIKLLSKDYDLYMLSSNSSELIKSTFEHQGIIKYFKGVAGDQEVGGLNKTDPQYVLAALRMWNLEPENVAYTGDTSDEVIGGRRAGVKTIGCTWGYQHESLIKASEPDAIAASPSELPEVIKSVFK